VKRFLLILTALPSLALAQAQQCTVPQSLPDVRPENPRPGEVRNLRATSYLLALSWSPEFCRRRGDDPQQATQCGGASGTFGFILHGLWPDVAGKEDPAWCGPAKPLDEALIRRHFCMTPSPQLLTHEWSKHGTCASTDPEKYFKAASLLFEALRFPDMDRLSRSRLTVSGLKTAFVSANRGIRPDMIAVDLNKDGWLRGVNLCLDANLKPRSCAPEDKLARPERLLRIWRAE
jgi:ribonuclease T2